MPVSWFIIWIISLASILCMLLRPRGIAEAYWVCSGGVLLVLFRLIPVRQAAHAVYEGLDVYLFLAGMMILAELAREEHVFEWVADVAARHARNSPARLFALVYLTGTVVTALLSNDATAVVLTPAVLAVVRRARVQPKPYLLACALIANAASFIFPISNPANLVVFDQHMPPLMAWLSIFILPSFASVLVTFFCLRWIYRKDLRGGFQGTLQPVSLSTEGKLALAGLLFAAATCAAAIIALALVVWRDQSIVRRVAQEVSWSVLPLVAGLFVIVEALQNAGLLRLGLAGLRALSSVSTQSGKFIASFAVALLSNGMNNLPVGLMSGAAIRHANESGIVAHALLIGVDLGPNLSVTGSLATILWLIALRREDVKITTWEFFRVGMVAMPLALAAAVFVLRS
jgi:arsenical pump membrane protein